jgi:hypothetical protein
MPAPLPVLTFGCESATSERSLAEKGVPDWRNHRTIEQGKGENEWEKVKVKAMPDGGGRGSIVGMISFKRETLV